MADNKSTVSVDIGGDLEGALVRLADTQFYALQLACRNDVSWAVIGSSSGAIAEDDNGNLLMRLTEPTAVQISEKMTRARCRQPERDPAPVN